MQVLKTWKNQKKLITEHAWRKGESDAEQGLSHNTAYPDVIGDPEGYVVTLYDNHRGRELWLEVYNGAYDSVAEDISKPYTVVGAFEHTNERWADTFYVDSPEEAEALAPDGLIVAGVFEGELWAVL